MSEFKIIHRAFSKESSDQDHQPLPGEGLVWKTCLRQLIFLDKHQNYKITSDKEEIYIGLEAECFLAEVLCGLKSPLVGETEVFGQFKNWWKNVSAENHFKRKFKGRVETLYALTKTVREKALCGHGSQSYGSLLRKSLVENEAVDFIGAGHLVGEILPWVQNKTSYRIWCRDVEKVAQQFQDASILGLSEKKLTGKVIVVAAPISHDELNHWLKERGFSAQHKIFDFRADSASFKPFVKPQVHLRLHDFSSEYDVHQNEIQMKAQEARYLIQQWKEIQESKMQVRPFGWDDL